MRHLTERCPAAQHAYVPHLRSDIDSACRAILEGSAAAHMCCLCCVAAVAQANAGQLDITGISPTNATLDQLPKGLACEGGLDVRSMDLAAGENATCTGTFTFDQATFEVGPKSFQASFTAGRQLAAPAESNVVVVTPQRVAMLKAVIHQDTCTTPEAAGTLIMLCANI